MFSQTNQCDQDWNYHRFFTNMNWPIWADLGVALNLYQHILNSLCHWATSYVHNWGTCQNNKKASCHNILIKIYVFHGAWWRHQRKTFSALLAICEGNPPVTVAFPSQRPVTRSFDIVFDLRLIKRIRKHFFRRRRWRPFRNLDPFETRITPRHVPCQTSHKNFMKFRSCVFVIRTDGHCKSTELII